MRRGTVDIVSHHFAEINGIRMHYAVAGHGPLVVLCHGWPELWYSWRHQIPALVAAGYRVVVPDQRGYGQTERPSDPLQYTQMHLVGDIVGLVHELGADKAVIVGHDFGVHVACHAAIMRPDMFTAAVAISVPFRPRGRIRPSLALREAAAGRFHYQLYILDGVLAEQEFEKDVRSALRRTIAMKDGGAVGDQRWQPTGENMSGILDHIDEPSRMPAWLSSEDLEYFVAEFGRTGFGGSFAWYRALDASWEMSAPFAGCKMQQPALYIAGDSDPAMEMPGLREYVASMEAFVPRLSGRRIIPGCGHWVQMEKPESVNSAILEFLEEIKSK